MSVARAIQVSIMHVALGIAIGSVIEGALPGASADASLHQQVFEMLVQAGLNGASIALVGAQLQYGDPTFGIPFSMALFQAQPAFAQRIEFLSSVVTSQVAQGAQRMKAPIAAA